jgi:ribosomal 50S subunit-recycling heat shock protein
MRLDQFLQKTGIVKRRSLAKQLCDSGAVEINSRKAKPAHEVAQNDTLTIKFSKKRCTYSIQEIPSGNVRKEDRLEFVRLLSEEQFHERL